MNHITLTALTLILAGAVVMLINLFKFRKNIGFIYSLSPEIYRKLHPFIQFHQILILFFFAGYLIVTYSMAMRVDLMGNLFVGLVFFFGAIFVLLGILLQNRMIVSIQNAYNHVLLGSQRLETQQADLMREIKDRKEIQLALHRSQSFLQHIIDAFPEPLMVINRDYSIALSNRRARETAAMDTASGPACCYRISHGKTAPCDERDHACPLQSVIREKTRVTVEHVHHDADGGTTVVEIIAAPIFNENNEVIQVIESCRDITARKRMEERVAHIQKMDAVGTLAGGIAHDFNNILSIIMGYAEMSLLDAAASSPLTGKINRILQASRRAKELVNQILTFSRRKETHLKPVDLQQTVRETLDLLRATIPSTIEFRHRLNAENGLIMADATQIQQVLMNLCANAAHAMRADGGRLTVSIEDSQPGPDSDLLPPDLPPGPCLRLTVSDTGHGMDPKTLDRIFEPFFTTKGPGEGTGLGLSTVHGIVQHIDGAIKVESSPGAGTTFNIFIPRLQSDAIVPAPEKNLTRGGSERILLVDDEIMVLEITAEMLAYFGYEVVSASGSREALELFKQQPDRFDLVMTDQTMPHMTGEKLTDELKRIRSDIPVILCTGNGDRIIRTDPSGHRFSGLLLKPIVLDELGAAVRAALDQGKSAPEPASSP
ncbi:MAG: hybrid sensor histidine kinase/response regulator [Thermodesulfobacteriota bacterium]